MRVILVPSLSIKLVYLANINTENKPAWRQITLARNDNCVCHIKDILNIFTNCK